MYLGGRHELASRVAAVTHAQVWAESDVSRHDLGKQHHAGEAPHEARARRDDFKRKIHTVDLISLSGAQTSCSVLLTKVPVSWGRVTIHTSLPPLISALFKTTEINQLTF